MKKDPTPPAMTPWPSEKAGSVLLASTCLALSMSLVGIYVALSKPLLAVFPIFLLAWLRFGLGGMAMLHWLKKPACEPPLSAATHGFLFLAALLGNFLFTICMLYGMRLSSAVTAGLVMASIPAAVALLSRLMLGERMGRRLWLAVLLAVTGVSLAQLAQPSSAGHARGESSGLLGPLLLLAAVMCEAAYAVIGKKLTRTLSPRRISALINLWGLVLMTPWGLMQAWAFNFGHVGAGAWGLLLFYAMAASVWTVWLWMTGLQTIPASHSGIFTVFLPLSAATVGVLALGESMQWPQLLPFVIALSGVLLATWPEYRSATRIPLPPPGN